jgi:ABC-3C protein
VASSHGAAASALGYLYQSQWPLVEIVRRSAERPDFELTLEMYDDVSWELDGTPQELLQVKHHLNSTRSLGDMDEDLWRTIAVWMDAGDPGDADGPSLTLITTQSAAAGTACEALRPSSHDPVEAVRLLENAARDSTSVATAASRARFLDLTDPQRTIFVGRIQVLDNANQIQDLDGDLRKELHLVLPHGHEDVFMGLLWAWWYQIAVGLLRRDATTISALDIKEKISDLRDQFAVDNLPTLVGPGDFDPATEGEYTTRVFVQQLHWISLTNSLLQKAIVDYFRAYTQSARWVEDHLVGLEELDSFEDKLRDEWERAFEFMKMRLPADADADRLVSEGQMLFRAVAEQTLIRVRDRYSEAFFTRGKYHELADKREVGWHPAFVERLNDLLFGAAS